ncbi:hypothetical protein NDU88_001347 [Pleurodeles waltl]|uniref:Uncharacterized protein n=1 Tax=Pleurodeles waltl TaxID=8319 RepID=A0AAV7SZ95_PLEWA|nr:hypothetical protein NDU88_001347 [Pleurodeles waltl]
MHLTSYDRGKLKGRYKTEGYRQGLADLAREREREDGGRVLGALLQRPDLLLLHAGGRGVDLEAEGLRRQVLVAAVDEAELDRDLFQPSTVSRARAPDPYQAPIPAAKQMHKHSRYYVTERTQHGDHGA